MKAKLMTLTLVVSAVALFAQDAVTEPEYANQFFALADGKIQPLERQNMKLQAQVKKRFVYTKGTTAKVVDGAESTIKVFPDAHFVVRMDVGDMDPSTMIFLKQFRVEKNEREMIMTTKSANIATGPNTQQRADDSSLPFTVKRYGAKSFEIIPSQPLVVGEYFLSATGSGMAASQVYCFSVVSK